MAAVTTALLVIGNGRLHYLARAIDAAFTHLPTFDHYLMIDDSGDPAVHRALRNYSDFHIVSHEHNLGMAKAVQSGFDLVLTTDADYTVWLEEDFLITRPLPIAQAIGVLTAHPHLAQMLFQRQPLTPAEHNTGSVLGAMGPIHDTPYWAAQQHIFSLNPCVIPRHILELGWPADNEAGFTKRLLADGYWFGVWKDGSLVEHIGTDRGAQWQL